MNEKELELLIDEAAKTKETWTQLALQSIIRFHDNKNNNSERLFNLILALSSISVAFLAIVVPLIKGGSWALGMSTILPFLSTAIFGVVSLIIVLKIDDSSLDEIGQMEDEVLEDFQNKSNDIYLKLIKYQAKEVSAPPVDEINEYLGLKEKIHHQKAEMIKKQEGKPLTKVLNVTIKLFWISLVVSFFCLGFWFLTSNNASEKPEFVNNHPVRGYHVFVPPNHGF